MEYLSSSERRRLAIRAAQVASLGLAVAALSSGCNNPPAPVDAAAADAARPDAVAVDAFVGDAPSAVNDGGPADAPSTADAVAIADASFDVPRSADAAPGADAPAVDAPQMADAGCTAFPPVTQECCALEPGGSWDGESMMCFVAVPGPFVPPAIGV